jgi:Immunity protein 50
MPPESFIIDAAKVLARFGKWPHFHDMEVVSVQMDRRGPDAPWIELVILVWKYTGSLTPDGHYEQTKHSFIRFRCERVTANQFDDFNHQNVLDGLEFSQADGAIDVRLPSIYGVGGSVSCGRVRVIDVVPARPDETANQP